MTAPHPSPATRPAGDRTMLWGALGIAFAVCCPLLGIAFGILSLNEARRAAKPPTPGYVAIVVAVGMIILYGVARFTGTV